MPITDTLARFDIPEVEAGERITGFVGLVVQPDAVTIRRSYELAAAVMPTGGELLLAAGLLPHVTLTQCALRDAPRERVAAYVQRLGDRLRGRTIPLGAVVAFGGGFLFWCVDPASPERALLRRVHADALTVADGFLDPVANLAVVEGTMKMNDHDDVLVANARRYGYAFVNDRYLPHITLGFDPRLAIDPRSDSGGKPRAHPHTMTAERVVAVRLGRHARAEQVLAL